MNDDEEFDAIRDVSDRFSPLTLDELRILEAHLQEIIAERLTDTGFELEQQLKKIYEIAAEKGLKLKSVQKKVYPAKFRNPEPPHQEWSGRGRRPNWMRNYDVQFGDEQKSDDYCAIPLPGLTPAE